MSRITVVGAGGFEPDGGARVGVRRFLGAAQISLSTPEISARLEEELLALLASRTAEVATAVRAARPPRS